MKAVLHDQAVSLSRLPGQVGLQSSHDWVGSLAGLPATGCAQKLSGAIKWSSGLPRVTVQVTVQAPWSRRATCFVQ